jgi:hypothetical protein
LQEFNRKGEKGEKKGKNYGKTSKSIPCSPYAP